MESQLMCFSANVHLSIELTHLKNKNKNHIQGLFIISNLTVFTNVNENQIYNTDYMLELICKFCCII